MDEPRTTQSADDAWVCMEQINEAWLHARLDRLADLFHPGLVMALPGFAGLVEGAESVIAGFVDFCSTCRVDSADFSGKQVQVIDRTAIAAFSFDIVYERHGDRRRSTGRDLWVLQRGDNGWRAVWRTMLDLCDVPLPQRSPAAPSDL